MSGRPKQADAERDARLKAALRANLQRRKMQTRARATTEDAALDGDNDDTIDTGAPDAPQEKG